MSTPESGTDNPNNSMVSTNDYTTTPSYGGTGYILDILLYDCDPLPPITPEVIARIQRDFLDDGTSSLVDATSTIWKVVSIVLFLVGMLGNILTIVVIVRQRRLTSTTVFLLALAFSDMLFLCNVPLRQWIRNTFEEYDDYTEDMEEMNWRQWSEHGCKASVFLTYSSLHMSSWILVAVTMERVVSVIWPHKIRTSSTIKSSVIVVVVLVVVILGLDTHLIYGFGKSEDGEFEMDNCVVKYDSYVTFASKYWPWIDFAVTFLIPFVFLVIGNGIIIFNLRRTRVNRRRMSTIESESLNTFEKETRVLTITLILLGVVFFICLTPIQVYLIYIPYGYEEFEKLRCKNVTEWLDQLEVLDLWWAITNCFGYINASFNFILYVISGSKFRKEILALFLCLKPGKKPVFGMTTNENSRKLQRSVTASTELNSNSSVRSHM